MYADASEELPPLSSGLRCVGSGIGCYTGKLHGKWLLRAMGKVRRKTALSRDTSFFLVTDGKWIHKNSCLSSTHTHYTY
jgi:hypothetical protein